MSEQAAVGRLPASLLFVEGVVADCDGWPCTGSLTGFSGISLLPKGCAAVETTQPFRAAALVRLAVMVGGEL